MSGTDLQPRQDVTLVTGERFDLAEAEPALDGLLALARLKDYVAHYEAMFKARLIAESEVEGTKTLHYTNGTVTIGGGPTDTYDAEELRTALFEVGVPGARVEDAVQTRITYRPMLNELKRLAAANPRYRAAIESVRVTEVLPKTVRFTPTPRRS